MKGDKKRGQVRSLFMIFMLVLSVISVSAVDYNVTNWTTLNAMRNNLTESYVLLNDLNSSMSDYETFNNHSTAGWIPVGTISSPFSGTFDGQNFTIEGLYINNSSLDNVGLFGYTEESNISNVGLENVSVKGLSYVGSLVGYAYSSSSIDNSYSTGNVNGTSYVGGLVGRLYSDSSIDNSYSTGNVNGTSYVGGLVGHMQASSIVSNSYTTGNVNGTTKVGGLVGYAYSVSSSINDSYTTGNVTGSSYVGGLVGHAYMTSIDNSYSTGNVNGTTKVGGLVGTSSYSSLIDNSFSTGNVNGTSYVGGLVGRLYSDSSIDNSYTTGNVTGSSYVGGLFGYNDGFSVDNSYWYNSTANQDLDCYDGGNEGCTAIDNLEYFYNYSNAPMNVWNFVSAWDNVLNLVSYPVLLFQNVEDISSPVVTLVSPQNQTETPLTSGTVSLMFNVSDYSEITNCTAYVNSVEYENETAVSKTATNTIEVTSLLDGTYSWYMNCTDVNGNVGQSEIWSFVVAVPEIVLEETTHQSSGGSVLSKVVSFSALQNGETQTLTFGTKMVFPHQGQNHTIWLRNVNRDKAEVVIDVYSEKQTVSLSLNEVSEIDVDKDGENDYKISLLKIYDNSAKVDLKIEAIDKSVFVDENKTENVSVDEVEVVDENSLEGYIWILAILILVLLVVAGFVLWSRRDDLQPKKKR